MKTPKFFEKLSCRHSVRCYQTDRVKDGRILTQYNSLSYDQVVASIKTSTDYKGVFNLVPSQSDDMRCFLLFGVMESDFWPGLVVSFFKCKARFGMLLTNFVSLKTPSFKRARSSSAVWMVFDSDSKESKKSSMKNFNFTAKAAAENFFPLSEAVFVRQNYNRSGIFGAENVSGVLIHLHFANGVLPPEKAKRSLIFR